MATAFTVWRATPSRTADKKMTRAITQNTPVKIVSTMFKVLPVTRRAALMNRPKKSADPATSIHPSFQRNDMAQKPLNINITPRSMRKNPMGDGTEKPLTMKTAPIIKPVIPASKEATYFIILIFQIGVVSLGI